MKTSLQVILCRNNCLNKLSIYVFLIQECYLENDQTSLYHTAKGLMTLQALYGTIPQIYGKGECARVSVKCMMSIVLLVQLNALCESETLRSFSACCQHDAADEEGVCWHSESDPARVRHSSPSGPQRGPAHPSGHTAHLWRSHWWDLWN